MNPIDSWRAAVAAGKTQLGYPEWLEMIFGPKPPETAELRPFVVYFDRDVIAVDTFKRIIYARSGGEAEALAEQAASEFNSECPDDVLSGTGECGYWDSSVSSGPSAEELAAIPVWAPADA
jgi:hypothetical protein